MDDEFPFKSQFYNWFVWNDDFDSMLDMEDQVEAWLASNIPNGDYAWEDSDGLRSMYYITSTVAVAFKHDIDFQAFTLRFGIGDYRIFINTAIGDEM